MKNFSRIKILLEYLGGSSDEAPERSQRGCPSRTASARLLSSPQLPIVGEPPRNSEPAISLEDLADGDVRAPRGFPGRKLLVSATVVLVILAGYNLTIHFTSEHSQRQQMLARIASIPPETDCI